MRIFSVASAATHVRICQQRGLSQLRLGLNHRNRNLEITIQRLKNEEREPAKFFQLKMYWNWFIIKIHDDIRLK